MWDSRPWDNDRAADWFGNLMDITNLPDSVRQTLLKINEEDPYGENAPILRAAAYCLLQFGHVYVWPIDHLREDLQLAIDALEKVINNEEYCYSEDLVKDVETEHKELIRRLEKLN